jgi:hypothetical protein
MKNLYPPIATSFESYSALAAVAANAAIFQLQNPLASGRILGVTRIKLINTTAVLTEAGLVVPATEGTPNVSLTALAASYIPGVAVGVVNTGWTVAPTYAATPAYYRGDQAAAAISSSFEWVWPEEDPLTVGAGSSVVLRNLAAAAATAALKVSVRWKELIA